MPRTRRTALLALAILAGFSAIAPTALAAGTLTVTIAGAGKVTGSGIDCTRSSAYAAPSGPCSNTYADTQICDFELRPPCWYEPTTVSLNATTVTGAGYAFGSWSGCSSASGASCTVNMFGNQAVTAQFNDVQGPSVALTAPTPGSYAGSVALAATATDNDGVAKVEFQVRGTLVATDTSAPYGARFDTYRVPDGTAAVTAMAIDAAGNTHTSAPTTITIDHTAPTLAVSGPSGGTFRGGTTQSWTIAAGDATTGPPTVRCSVVAQGAPAAFGPCSGGSASHAVSDLPEGAYVLTVRATDGAGNTRDLTRMFAIDATPPNTTITAGRADGSSGTATGATFAFAATEPGSTFQCRMYQAALSPPAFGACSGGATHAAAGFSPGTYTFEVRAVDAVGNPDPTPARRTFTVTAAPPSEPGGGGPSGGGDASGAPAPAGEAAPTHANPARVVVRSRHSRRWTRLTRLVVRHVRPGSTVRVSCKGGRRRGCRKRRFTVTTSGTVRLRRLARGRLRPGVVITIRVSTPGATTATTRIVIRKGRKPRLR